MNRQVQAEREFREFFGRRLRTARVAANLSQKGLAQRLKTGQDTISNYERGKIVPNMLTLFHLSEVLVVNVDYFFPDERFQKLSIDDRETIALITSLSPRAYDSLLILLQFLAKSQQRPVCNLLFDPIKALERFLDDNIPSAMPNAPYPKENTEREIVFADYALIGLILLFLKICEGDTLDRKDAALIEKATLNGNFWRRLIHELFQSE